MYGARKGRASVISINDFEKGSHLSPLEGYKIDETKLCHLWDQIGFDLHQPTKKYKSVKAEVSMQY